MARSLFMSVCMHSSSPEEGPVSSPHARSDSHYPGMNSLSLSLGALLVLTMCTAIGLTGCDRPITAPLNHLELRVTLMPNGAELLTPGTSTPRKNADASAYGCYLSARPYSDAVAFHSRYLHFPEAITEAAGNQIRDVAYRVRVAAEPLPEGDISKAEIPRTSVGVRLARCTIPDTEEAEELTWEQVIKHGEAEAIAHAVETGDVHAGGNQGATPKSSEATCVIRETFTCTSGECILDTRRADCDSYSLKVGDSPLPGHYPDPG